MKNQSKGTNVLPAIDQDLNSELDETITKLIEAMSGHDAHAKEFTTMTDNLKTLMEARKIDTDRIKVLTEAIKLESENSKLLAEVRKIDDDIIARNTISRDTLALIGGNLAGIVMILSFEHANVLTSKALAHIIKIRL